MKCYSDRNVEAGLLKSHPVWWEMITSEGFASEYIQTSDALLFPSVFTYRPVII